MNSGKKTRYFTRDRCRQRKKRIAIGITLLLSIGLCGALFYMIVFADNYNSSGYATIKVVSPTGYSSTMKVTYKFAGPSDALKVMVIIEKNSRNNLVLYIYLLPNTVGICY